MPTLPEVELQQVGERVVAEAARAGVTLVPSPFLQNLVLRTLERYPPLATVESAAEDGEGEPACDPSLADLPGGIDDATSFVANHLIAVSQSPYFLLVQKVAVEGDSRAFEELMGLLDRNLRLKGILFRHGLNPDHEYPALWGKIWEAIPKWDGRDFRAYVARLARNYSLDDVYRRKRGPTGIEEDPHDVRPPARTAQVADTRDAVTHVLEVLDDLETLGRISPLDAVIFSLITEGRAVADVVAGFHGSPALDRLGAALAALKAKRLRPQDALLLRYLIDGLSPAEAATVTGRAAAGVAAVARALGPGRDEDEVLLLRAFAREGIGPADLTRARRLTANAVNLCINRIRLKMWMSLVDRAYEALARRGEVDAVDEAILRARCTVDPPGGCRMYKDRKCKREAPAAEIARRAGVGLSPQGVGDRLDELRVRILERGLGQVFPDYNACLTERKPAAGAEA